MAGEFGLTRGITGGPSYKTPGRNHWGSVQSIFLAGRGIQCGRVIGAPAPTASAETAKRRIRAGYPRFAR